MSTYWILPVFRYVRMINIVASKIRLHIKRPLAQILCSGKVSANKLLKLGNKEIFEQFVQDVKNEVDRNYNNYRSDIDFEEDYIKFDLFTSEMLKNS